LCLANWINVLPSLAVKDLDYIFNEYYDERYPKAMAAFRTSATNAKRMKMTTSGAIVRYLSANMPKWLWVYLLKKRYEYRPQASFLDLAEDKGTVRPIGQLSLAKTKVLIEALCKKEQQQKAASPLPSSTAAVDPIAV
jgi:hypothetical protein